MSLLAWLLCLLLPARVMAETDVVDGIWYDFNTSTKTASVVQWSSTEYAGDIVIPSTVAYGSVPYTVASIGSKAFYLCHSLTSVTIPESVTSILDQAFYGCSGLTSLTIPKSVTSIGRLAFNGCRGLTSLTIPKSVTSIGYHAFSGCSGLTSIVVESGNPVYDSRENCNALIETSSKQLLVGCKNTVIPNSVTSIGDQAFYGCSGLTSITIPEGVTSIGFYAFYGCSHLATVNLSRSVTSIGWYAFYACPITSITIPERVTEIAYGSFWDCKSLTSVTLPSSVASIGDMAFNGCSALTSVIIENPTPVSITSDVFTNRANATLYVPAGSKAAYEAADYWKEFKAIVEMAPLETFAVMLDGVEQTLEGKWVVSDDTDFIVSSSVYYRVTGRKARSMGDVNSDGKITIADVTALVNVILGHGSVGPAVIYEVERAEE